jgi:hypothetical protein
LNMPQLPGVVQQVSLLLCSQILLSSLQQPHCYCYFFVCKFLLLKVLHVVSLLFLIVKFLLFLLFLSLLGEPLESGLNKMHYTKECAPLVFRELLGVTKFLESPL